MMSNVSKKMPQLFNGTLSKFLCCLALVLTTLVFPSCDKDNASLEATVRASGQAVSNFPITLKTGSTTYTVSTNLNGIALFSDLSGGDYTASWPATVLTFANGAQVSVVAGSKAVSISKGSAQTLTLTLN